MKINRFLKAFILIALLSILGFYVNIDYYVMRPSRAVDLGQVVEVETAEENDRGIFYLLTVTQQRASIFTAVYGYLHPHMVLNPKERVIPKDMDEDEYRDLLEEHMEESQYIAQVVALRRAGYDVDIVSEGVEVVDFLDDAPAEGYLQVGDKITHVDDKNVVLASEVPLLVQDRQVGEEVAMEIVRNGREITFSVPTGPHIDDGEVPFIGIYIKTLLWEPVVPVDIVMDTANIAGPSAGLMFVLEIMNQVLPEDLSAGKTVAGTGTIDLDENIGSIGGVSQKVIAAEEAGIDYLFVPRENYEQARKAAQEVQVVPVSELEEALEFLSKLDNQGEHNHEGG